MTPGLPARQLAADLSGVRVLDLVVTDCGDGTDSDHADWADATITC
ncbi:NPCBM/NEW2 domain-containing protein [Amycolatopsis mongoliensis]